MNDFRDELSSLKHFQMEKVYENIIDSFWNEYGGSETDYNKLVVKLKNLDEYIFYLWNSKLTDVDIEVIKSLTVNQKKYFDDLIITSMKELNYI